MYKSFNAAVKQDFNIDIKMNENMHGFISADDINIGKVAEKNIQNEYVKKQEFKFMDDKWTYVIDATDKYDFDGITSKPLVVYQKLNKNKPEVFRQGVFTFKKRENNRLFFVKIAK